MTNPTVHFGTELRRQRMEAGLSLAGLAKRVHYSKSHLSKVETGLKPPSADLARQCDALLARDGSLVRLAKPLLRRSGSTPDDADPPATEPPAPVPHPPIVAAEPTVASFRTIFDQVRQLGQWVSPGLLIPQLGPQVDALGQIAARSGPDGRDAALVLAARFAEYAGWLAQESGDDQTATWWTRRAVALATAGGDGDMEAYAMVRYGLIALYRHDAIATVELARAAQAAATNPRIRGLAAQREAQGHAVAGDYDACMRALERSTTLLSAAQAGGEPVIGSSNVADVVAMTTGWCLFDLGQPEEAARILGAELARIPPGAMRARARWGARLALAHASAGDPRAACTAVTAVLDTAGQLDSATVRADLRYLARMLNRWHADPETRATRLRLTDALNTAVEPR